MTDLRNSDSIASKQPLSAREAAFLAVVISSKGHRFAEDVLSEWNASAYPSLKDFQLAKQIAYGTIQMALALDHLAKQLTTRGQLKLKSAERILLRCALYQAHFMDRIPHYAIVDESVQIARKQCHPRFAAFLNATLRSYPTINPSLPADDDVASLSIHYSYPESFVSTLVQQYGTEKAKNILIQGNTPPQTMVRLRNSTPLPENCTSVFDNTLRVARLTDASDLKSFTNSPEFYIQNATQVHLLDALSRMTAPPKRILDLCAAPGGKSLAAHDLYPEASLTVNDISSQRIQTLKENLSKYNVEATVSLSPGEEFTSETLYDLIILDVPCSNSGVLNKRPEARWRLTSEALQELAETQLRLIQHARNLLAPGGVIWYLTCSILPQENEQLIQRSGLSSSFQETVLPNAERWDGGFGCLLQSSL